MLPGQGGSGRRHRRGRRRAVAGCAAAREERFALRKPRSVARAGGRRAAQPRHMRGDGHHLVPASQVLRIGEVPHPQVLASRGTEILERGGDDRGRLPADRRHRAINDTAAIRAVTGRAIEIELRATRRGARDRRPCRLSACRIGEHRHRDEQAHGDIQAGHATRDPK